MNKPKYPKIFIVLLFILLVLLWLNSLTWFRLKLVQHYEQKNDRYRAIKIYNKIYRKEKALSGKFLRFYKLTSSQYYEINKKLADYFFYIKDKEKAAEHYKVLQRLNPEEIGNYLNLYILNQEVKDLVEIVQKEENKDFVKVIPSDYLSSPLWRFHLAISLAHNNKWQESEVTFQRLVTEFPFLDTFKKCLIDVQQKKIPDQIFDIIGIWKFDETEGDVARDYSGRWNNAKIYGAKWIKGFLGKALEFDGINDYLRIFRNESLNFKNFTFCVWIKPLNSPEHTSLVIRNGISGGHIAVHKNMILSTGFYDGFDWHILQGGSYKLNEWTFITAVLDNGILYIYQDGKLVVGPKDTGSFPVVSGDDLFFGKREDYLGYFKGIIDEIQIFNRALSEEEIRQLYQDYLSRHKEMHRLASYSLGHVFYKKNEKIL